MTVDVYHAIADANRRKLLELLCGQERSVQELMSFFSITIGGISQHLKVLLDAGLVACRKKGRFRLYHATPGALQEVHDWTLQCRQSWESCLDQLGDYLDDAP